MDSDNPRLRDLLIRAADVPLGNRAEFLDEACAGDEKLRCRVEKLLGMLERADGFLANPTLGQEASSVTIAALAEGPGTRIGNYKLLQQIGEGGMGIVFMAEQERPVKRRVAVKIIKPGMDSRQVIARFEAERQALAMMDHSNIARVFDAGTTESGRPYFVMELVHGVPITTFCDATKLTMRQRLELFLPVCSALQHAHQKGIIHRDLKPGNVLVTMHDDKPVPKIIDFGVAKAINQPLTEHTLFTEFRQLIGTPVYMSPEQAQMSGLDMDTRSDIYSLGVLLYELLTGTTPFDAKELCAAAYEEIQRIIREVEPPKPSLRLSTLATGTQRAVSDQRRCDPATLSRALEGDLDWIMMKCLEKDRSRRYETANGLARDIQRYLNEEPVEATPPSTTYRLRKLVRKHKREAIAVCAVMAALVLGIIGTSIGLAQARHNLADARAAEQRAQTNLTAAQSAEQQAQQSAHEMEMERNVATANEVKTREAAQREQSARQHAELIAHLLEDTFGTKDSVRQLERFYEESTKVTGAADPSTIIVADELAKAYDAVGRDTDAMKLLERVQPDASRAFGGRKTWNTFVVTKHLVFLYELNGRGEDAYRLAEQIRKPAIEAFDSDPARFSSLLQDLVDVYGRTGRVAEACTLGEHLRRVASEHFGPYNPDTIAITGELIVHYWKWGRTADAINLATQSRESATEKFGVDDPRTLPLTIKLVWLMANSDRTTDGIALAEPARRRALLDLGPDDSNTNALTHQLIWLYTRIGRLADATKLRQELWPQELRLKNRDIEMGPANPSLLIDRGWLYKKLGQSKEASVDFAHAIDLATERIRKSTSDSDTAVAFSYRAGLLTRLGRFAEALEDYRKAVELDPSVHLYWHNGLVLLLLKVGDLEGYRHWRSVELQRFRDTSVVIIAQHVAKDALAAPLDGDDLKVALELAERGSHLQGRYQWGGEQSKGMAEYRAGRFEQAIPRLLKSVELLQNGDKNQTSSLLFLAMAYEHCGKHANALASLEKARVNMAPADPDEMGDGDWIVAEAAFREAEELISGKAPATSAVASTQPVASR